jgi:hypothetical protein
MKFTDNDRPSHSPWGHIHGCENVATGIWRVDTASHGGYYLSIERIATMPKPLRDYVPFVARNGSGTSHWFEEDVDWCIVCLAYPGDFTRKMPVDEKLRVENIARRTALTINDPALQQWLLNN